MVTGQENLDERVEEEEPQSMLMRLIAMAKKRMTGEEAVKAAQAEETGDPAAPGPNAEPRKEPVHKEPAVAMMGKNNSLYMLLQKSGGHFPDPEADMPFSMFMDDGSEPESDERRCLQAMMRSAGQILQNLRGAEAKLEQEPDKKPDPIPAKFYIQAAGNRMRAWGFVMAPLYGGADITVEAIREELERQKVVFGVDERTIQRIVSQKRYFKLFLIAQGRQPVNGEDGRIEDYFLRNISARPDEDENNNVDYKNLNWIQKVEQGQTICDIVPPTEAVNGVNILGASVQGRSGKKAIPPKGKNTEVTEDELRLIASVGGQVEFSRGQFHVEQLTNIHMDVDNSTGNIDVIGNVVIGGDVREGFVVKATGDISVKGKVEGAFIIAGGNVQIGMGMNGSLTGTLEAKGDVRTKYLENCTVHAGGCIYSDSIVNSNVSSDRDICITYGVGAIIGGSVMAANTIDAKLIGNKSNRTTALILGGTPGVLKEKSDTEAVLKDTLAEIDEIRKNLAYIERAGNQTVEYKKLQNDFKLKLSTLNIRQAKLNQRLAEIKANLDPTNCRLTCKTIYPITQITIGNATRILREPAYNCNIFYAEGEVRVGTK